MTIKVDKDTCIGCGSCASICPEVFEMNGSKAKVKDPDSEAECAEQAEEACPVNAISS